MGTWHEQLSNRLRSITFDNLNDGEVLVSAAFAVVVFLVPLYLSLGKFLKQNRSSHYSALDDMYSALLNIAIDNPSFRDRSIVPKYVEYLKRRRALFELQESMGTIPDSSSLGDDPLRQTALQYAAYAFMVYNFLETIHDRCNESAGWLTGRPDKTLRNTWEGIIGDEHRLHSKWFEFETIPFNKDRSKFCIGFAHFMWENRRKKPSWRYWSAVRIYLSHAEKFDGNGTSPLSKIEIIRRLQIFKARIGF